MTSDLWFTMSHFKKAYLDQLPPEIRNNPAAVCEHIEKTALLLDGAANLAGSILGGAKTLAAESAPLGLLGLAGAPLAVGAGLGLGASKLRKVLDPIIPESSDLDLAQARNDEYIDRLSALSTQSRIQAEEHREKQRKPR
jgi:hypothetical protein